MEKLHDLKERLEQQRPVPWEKLPDFGLYMDQVISYMPRQLIHFDEGELLTSAMVNNYIKDGLLPRAHGKRYSQVHVGYLTAVACLKKVLTVRETGVLLEAGRELQPDPETLYTCFCSALDRALQNTADHLNEETRQEDLARIALDLALESYASQLACTRILEILAPEENSHRKNRK